MEPLYDDSDWEYGPGGKDDNVGRFSFEGDCRYRSADANMGRLVRDLRRQERSDLRNRILSIHMDSQASVLDCVPGIPIKGYPFFLKSRLRLHTADILSVVVDDEREVVACCLFFGTSPEGCDPSTLSPLLPTALHELASKPEGLVAALQQYPRNGHSAVSSLNLQLV